MEPRHEFEEHTSEVKVRMFAPTLPTLFAEACRALADVMAGSPALAAPAADEPVEVRGRDREALLTAWLNELVYRSDWRGRIYTAVEIERLSDTELKGRIGGTAVIAPKTPVKAATMHELSITPLEKEQGWTASVVLDV